MKENKGHLKMSQELLVWCALQLLRLLSCIQRMTQSDERFKRSTLLRLLLFSPTLRAVFSPCLSHQLLPSGFLTLNMEVFLPYPHVSCTQESAQMDWRPHAHVLEWGPPIPPNSALQSFKWVTFFFTSEPLYILFPLTRTLSQPISYSACRLKCIHTSSWKPTRFWVEHRPTNPCRPFILPSL